MANKKLSIKDQVNEILSQAEEKGVSTNYFFLTTFKRYQVKLKILNELEMKINDEGAMVTKEYVKGRANLYTNPAISEYNKTSTAANNDVKTLIEVINKFAKTDQESQGNDKLEEFLNAFNGFGDN